ncbi:MAG: TadE/TadG family type IV pilus assembly protein [Sphingomicrobium sp.]
MILFRRLVRNEEGAAVIEMAFALPVLVLMIWMLVQLAQVYRAVAGIQQALGQGARYATLCLNPSTAGCSIPTGTQVHDKMLSSVFGIGPGSFTPNTPTKQTSGTGSYYDLQVSYVQPTSLLFVPGPTITVVRKKRVWMAG